MMQALVDAACVLYYRWALNGLHPAHPDATHVLLKHALHSARLERFLHDAAPQRARPL